MRIAILGWGSLRWDDSYPAFDVQHGEWADDGPVLPVEFSRISRKRKSALTLVIDEENGEPCQVGFALSRRATCEEAAEDLRIREETTAPNVDSLIVRLAMADSVDRVRHSIQAWASAKKLDAVVWTGLKSNFVRNTGHAFSIARAIAHLDMLSAEGRCHAVEYFQKAPDAIDTPLRRALRKRCAPWAE